MSFDEWKKLFKPIQNYWVKDASFDGCMFETYGVEREFVVEQKSINTWTLIEDDEEMFIVEGYVVVNRLGYFITEKSWQGDVEYEIKID